jgi:hypothetical protein
MLVTHEQLIQSASQLRTAQTRGITPSDDDQITRLLAAATASEPFTHAAFDVVAHHCVPHLATHRDA